MLIHAQSPRAARALALVEDLQRTLVAACRSLGADPRPVHWLRDEGRHGGGTREVVDHAPFDRASVNVSQVHYDDLPQRQLASATALSTILHPLHPRAPSMHMHISLTEMRDGRADWRLMADLNPSIPNAEHTRRFEAALREATGVLFEEGNAQGDRYFHIPVAGRHRGVKHYYLEQYDSGDFEADLAFAHAFGTRMTACYTALVQEILSDGRPPSAEEQALQLAYHTLYFFQVLTLDRGTTSGLLVHDQNDIGILGSLPSHVDRDLLRSWVPKMPAPQDELLEALIDALPPGDPCPVTQACKPALAAASRAHYRRHPEALALQATGDRVPPTVGNHR